MREENNKAEVRSGVERKGKREKARRNIFLEMEQDRKRLED